MLFSDMCNSHTARVVLLNIATALDFIHH
jgi:hypothetical protein